MYRPNKYSWCIIIAYIPLLLAMEYHSSNPMEGFYLSFPFIVATVFWSEKLYPLVQMNDDEITKEEAFIRDLFLLFFSFVLANMISLLFESNNVDVLGWWPIIILVSSVVGILFAFYFSFTALLLDHHKIYTFVFSLVVITSTILTKCFPTFISIMSFSNIRTFHALIILLMFAHLLSCLIYKITRIFLKII